MCKIGFLQLIRKHKRRWEPGCGDIETVGKVESPCREIGTFVHCRNIKWCSCHGNCITVPPKLSM